jgi:hypothetical protein
VIRYGSVCSGIEEKTCTMCRVEKPLSAFHRQGARRHSYCADCYNARYRGKARKPLSAGARRCQNFRARYGISAAEADALLVGQGGVCAICRKPPARPVVDHCHKTGKVRSVLCHPCNVALPHVEDEAFRTAALAYLRERN